MAMRRGSPAVKSRDIPPNSNAQETRRGKEEWTERSGWWKQTLKDTPVPGTYNIRDFLEEAKLNPLQHQTSYFFRSCHRPGSYTLGIRDKDINLSPCHYDVTEKPVSKLPCKHVMFRSGVQRVSFLPSSHAGWICVTNWQLLGGDRGARVLSYPLGAIKVKKEGPSPCQYTMKSSPANGITSCFRSTVPRLHSIRSRTPGPGTYELSGKMGPWRFPEDMSHISGLYFRNVF